MLLKFRPKLDKIVEALLYLAHHRPDADKYLAVKLLYLADREHLIRYGRPITFDNYFAFEHGPAPSKAMDLLEEDKWVMKEAGLKALPFVVEPGKAPNGSPTVFIRKPLRDINLNLFSGSDTKVLDEAIANFGNADFKFLWKLTHGHEAYKTAWGERREGKRAPMFYEEMIEDKARRDALVEDFSAVAANI